MMNPLPLDRFDRVTAELTFNRFKESLSIPYQDVRLMMEEGMAIPVKTSMDVEGPSLGLKCPL
jgi:hypothetical protein